MKDFYVCGVCGNVVEKIKDSGVPVICCGQPMNKMEIQSTDSTNEKHVPLIEVDGTKVKVTVGSTLHPMTKEHHISMIVLETDNDMKRQFLDHEGEPVAYFNVCEGEKVLRAYELCNIHGLWKSEE